jgi:glucose/arabinose dehydrogenase
MFGEHQLLFITTGDGGIQGDGNHNAEQLGDLKAKILRIDAFHGCGTHRYCVPATNPFPHARDHNKRLVFDWGFRNPWRASIDRKTGDLWVGDVGQDSYEEIDHTRQVGGKDFGWSCREGTHSFNTANCTINGQPRQMTDPVHDYPHTNGRCAVIGGYVYRGPKFPFADGIYVYADYCGGQVYGLEHTSTGWHNAQVGLIGSPTGFGLADNGELYVVTDQGSLAHVVFHRR